MPTNRRTVLKTGGMAALFGVTSLAGCTGGNSNGNSGGGSEGSNWQYDPSTLVDSQNRVYGTVDYAQMYENREYLPESQQESFETDSDSPVDASDIDLATGVGGGRASPQAESGAAFGSMAITGSFSKSDITGSMNEESETEQVGEYEGYTLYSNAEELTGSMGPSGSASATVGVGDGAMVVGFAGSQQSDVSVTGRDAVETMIDASNGNAELLYDNSQYAQTLTDSVDGQSMQMGGEVDPELVALAQESAGPQQQQFFAGIRAVGFGANIQGETTSFSFAGIYESSDAAESTGIKGTVQAFSDRVVEDSEQIDSLESERNGDTIIITMSGDTETIFSQAGSSAGTSLSLTQPGF